MQLITVIVGAVLLAGCASQATPSMDSQRYTAFAKGWVGINRCIESGAMDPATGALGKQYLQAELGKYSYFPDQLNKEVSQVAAITPDVPKAVCNQVASQIMGEKGRIDQHNLGVQRSEQALQNTLNGINNSRPIYCNTVGGVTMCN